MLLPSLTEGDSGTIPNGISSVHVETQWGSCMNVLILDNELSAVDYHVNYGYFNLRLMILLTNYWDRFVFVLEQNEISAVTVCPACYSCMSSILAAWHAISCFLVGSRSAAYWLWTDPSTSFRVQLFTCPYRSHAFAWSYRLAVMHINMIGHKYKVFSLQAVAFDPRPSSSACAYNMCMCQAWMIYLINYFCGPQVLMYFYGNVGMPYFPLVRWRSH